MMNNSRYLSLALFICLSMLVGSAIAQQRVVDKNIPLKDAEKVELDLKFGKAITVKAWDKNEISFRAVIEINNGKLNDALVLDFNKTDYGLTVLADYDETLLKEGRREDCPDSRFSTYHKNGSHTVICSNIVYEIYVPRSIDLELETISADIELLGLQGPIRAKSISGFVDLSWPQEQGAELSMKTISGEVYSGLDNLGLINRKGGVPLVGYELHGSIGMGGPRVNLESISGNIYLRKEN